jgi:hypothetical protein
MQKLVTIPLDDDVEENMEVQEHLTEYFQDNWKVVQMISVGSGVGTGDSESNGYVAGWIAALLEKNE